MVGSIVELNQGRMDEKSHQDAQGQRGDAWEG